MTGAQPPESDRSAMVGGANMVGADAFSGFDYVALWAFTQGTGDRRECPLQRIACQVFICQANTQKSVTIIDTGDFSRRKRRFL